MGYFIFGAAHTLWLLFLARLIDGFTGGNVSTAQAYIADVSAPADRAKNFGLIGAAFGLGFVLGPALGGILSHWSLRAPAYAAGILSLVTVTIGYLVLPESLPPERRTRTPFRLGDLHPLNHLGEALRRPGLARIFAAFFAMNFAMSELQSNFAVYTHARFGLGPQGNALLFTLVGVIGILVQGVLLRRIPTAGRERRIAMGGLFLMAIGFASTAFVPAVAWLYLAIGHPGPRQFGGGTDADERGVPQRDRGRAGLGPRLAAIGGQPHPHRGPALGRPGVRSRRADRALLDRRAVGARRAGRRLAIFPPV